jgi:hypothetical protein
MVDLSYQLSRPSDEGHVLTTKQLPIRKALLVREECVPYGMQ